MTPASNWTERKPGDRQPIIYQGGCLHDPHLWKPLRPGGASSFAASFVKEQEKPGHLSCFHDGKRSRLFLDSGAFSFLVAHQKVHDLKIDLKDYLKAYVAFVKNPPLPLDFYITFDYQPNAQIAWDMTKRLQRMGAYPTPVYHGDASIDWVKRYIGEGHKLIGLSKRFFLNDRSGLRRFYDQTFKVTEAAGVACHGFACTGREMWQYPWYSVDSTSIIGASGRGQLAYVENGEYRFFPIGKNRVGKHLPEDLKLNLERYGHRSLKEFSHYASCIEFNMRRFLEYHTSRQVKSWMTRRSLF